MRLSELKKVIPALYKTHAPLTLVGAPGIGKSDTVKEIPALLASAIGEEFGSVIMEASCIDAPDVIGFLIPTKNAEGEAIARYTKPDMIRQIELTGLDHGVLFVDEIGQADTLVQKAMAPLFIEGKLGEYRIPEGWWVVAATNRVEDRAGVVKELSHFTNRQCRINIEPHIEDYLVWAKKHNLHSMLTGFASFRPGVVMTQEVPAKPGSYCTPRSFTKAAMYFSNVVEADDMDLPNDPVTQQVISGFIGEAASAELFSFLKVSQYMPKWADIVNDPMKAKVPPKDRLDGAYAVAAMVTQSADAKTIEQGFKYCTRLPVEMQTSVARTLVTSLGGAALNSPSISKFISEHKSLILSSIS